MSSPFQVKQFSRVNSSDNSGGLMTRMNAWFEEIARDEINEYDIRQILCLPPAENCGSGSVLVFYEVTPAGCVED